MMKARLSWVKILGDLFRLVALGLRSGASQATEYQYVYRSFQRISSPC